LQLPSWKAADKAVATRQSSQTVLSSLVDHIPEIIGGSADLTPSNLTKVWFFRQSIIKIKYIFG
jgi:transketolase